MSNENRNRPVDQGEIDLESLIQSVFDAKMPSDVAEGTSQPHGVPEVQPEVYKGADAQRLDEPVSPIPADADDKVEQAIHWQMPRIEQPDLQPAQFATPDPAWPQSAAQTERETAPHKRRSLLRSFVQLFFRQTPPPRQPDQEPSAQPYDGTQPEEESVPAVQAPHVAQGQETKRVSPAEYVPEEPDVAPADVQEPPVQTATPSERVPQPSGSEREPVQPVALDRPSVQAQERRAFAAGEVITLHLHRSTSMPQEKPVQRVIFDQEEEAELEFMLADNARKHQANQAQTQMQQRAVEKRDATEPTEEAVEAAQAPQETIPQPEAGRDREQAVPEQQPYERSEAEAPALQQAGEPAAAQEARTKAAAAVMERPIAGKTAREPEAQWDFLDAEDEDTFTLPKLEVEPELLWKPAQARREPTEPEETGAPVPEAAQPEERLPLGQLPRPSRPVAAAQPQITASDFQAEGDDAELEAMLAAHAGPVRQRGEDLRAAVTLKGQPVRQNDLPAQQEWPGAPVSAPEMEKEEAAAAPAAKLSRRVPPVAAQPELEQPEPEQEPTQQATDEPEMTPVETEKAAAKTKRIPNLPPVKPEEELEEEEEDWDEDELADESLLERPERSPGLLQQLLGFVVSAFQSAPKEKERQPDTSEVAETAEAVKETGREQPAKRTPKRDKKGKPEAAAPKVIEMPQEKPHLLRKKWEEMEARANDFADAMFQGESAEAAEEEALYQKAERYIPGTDEERTPPRRRAKPKPKPKEPIRRAPDTSPKELSRSFYNSWKSSKGRLPFQFILAAVLIALGAVVDAQLPQVQEWLGDSDTLVGILLTAGLAGACVLGLDTLLEGIFQLFRGKPGLNTLASIGVLMTLIDSLWYSILTREGPLPFCGFAALSLWAVAWGNCRKKQGLYLSCQMAAAISRPQRLTLDQGKWDNKGTFIKETGTAKGFGSQIQEPDGAQRVYRYAAPVMIVACLLFGILAAVGQKSAQYLIWNWAVIFVLATPLSATLAYGGPYTKLVKRLNRSGVILAGWEGAASMRGEAGIAVTDGDLFPEGYVQFNGIKNFGQVSLEKLTGCTASVMREMDTGLAKIFDDLIRTQGGFYRRVDDLKTAEGGFSGLIRGDQVLVGCADYMNLMGVPLQQGYQVRNAVFCVINGQLQGIFALNYSLANNVKPALHALIYGGVNPILATRDFNITPTMLRQRFRLPTERMEYPPVDRRHLLSARGQPHNKTLGALIYREGLNACADAILGGRRLCTVVRLNTILAVAASVIGALLGFYLAMMGAYYSLSPLNILFFLAMWLLPALLISNGVDKF